MLGLNLEYRRTFFENKNFGIQGVLFTDFANLRIPGQNFKWALNLPTNRIHGGGGLRLVYKKAFNSVMRIDYGVGLDGQNEHGLVLGLGQFFLK